MTFYASNVAQTALSLVQACQMSQTTGGTETTVAVTMPSSGTNLYVEIASQGGSPGGNRALPSPSGKGFALDLSGKSIVSGNYQPIFTLSKSGSTNSNAILIARWSRRAFDGTYYTIGQTQLTSQTLSTTKTVYTFPSTNVFALWQFLTNDTFYLELFVFNGSQAWAGETITLYVSNSATSGVANDGSISTPTVITTPSGLSCLVGSSNFQSGSGPTVLNQSYTLADALDQRSVLNLTLEDPAGTLNYNRGQPVLFSDHDQGLIYNGFVNNDKVSKITTDSNTQLEHAITYMDQHYNADKRANTTNYMNWSAGDMVADFTDKTLGSEGVTGQYAIESDYSQASFASGTLSGTTATTTTSPFTYAPNTANPPVTTNTGDLELTRAGTQFTLTEQTTSDFASGTLNNTTASSNTLKPSTQSAVRVTATLPGVGAQNIPFGGSQALANATTVDSSAYVKIWSGSQLVAANDTLFYDLWISSTSPAFVAGIDLTFDDATTLTGRASPTISGGVWNLTSIWDQNYLSCDPMTDLTNYTKDCWYTRQVPLASVNGKHITSVSIYITGNPPGTYTVYAKNIYLGSASGSPFFSTSAVATQVNPPVVSCIGVYPSQLVFASVEQVYLPLTTNRISPAHSISGVGLVQNSTISWTASNPIIGPDVLAGTPGIATTAGNTLVFVSYDGNSWLPCTQNQALPGLPAGTNTSGMSLYVREQFQSGPDPTAIPSLLQLNITINSAASQTTSDADTRFGTTANWNTGTYSKTIGASSGGQLTTQTTISRDWNDGLITNQTFFTLNGATESVTSNKYQIHMPSSGSTNVNGVSRLDFLGSFSDFILDVDTTNPVITGSGAYNSHNIIYYRTSFWDTAIFNDLGCSIAYRPDAFLIGHGGNANNGVSTLTQSVNMTFTSATYHWKIVVRGNRHTVFMNNATTPIVDILDSTYTQGGVGFGCGCDKPPSSGNFTWDNLVITTDSAVGNWYSPSVSLNSLGTVGNTQVSWSELNNVGAPQSSAIVLASLDGGTTYQPCQNGAVVPTAAIPGLSKGTSVVGKSIQFQVILAGSNNLNVPYIYGLEARICGTYGTVTGTRVSNPLNLSNVGYVAASNAMWNANIPIGTTLAVATSQDNSSYTTVPNNGAGASLGYWTNQPAATQDLYGSNTSANYTSTFKTGGSVTTPTFDTTNTRLTLTGGSSALYLYTSISAVADVDLLVDMDRSDAGGLVWREVDTSNFYELGIYDASSTGGFTNQLRLYKVASNTRTLLGTAPAITFTRGTYHRIRVTMKGGLISVYWDGACVQSYLDTSPLSSGGAGLRNDGGTSRYYQLWIQPLGTNLSGQALYTKVTMTTTDPAYMPQLFVLVACIRGPNIATGATVSQLHPATTPFAVYYSTEMDTLVSASGDFYWYIDKWHQIYFAPRLARQGAFPIQDIDDPAKLSGSLLYQPQVSIMAASDLYRNQQYITDVTTLVTPPTEIKVADGNTTSWTMGYPLYSAPTITQNGQPGATIGIQGIDSGKQFYWQPGSPSISYDSTLPKLVAGTVLGFTYVGQSTQNIVLNNSSQQSTLAAIENNTGIIAEIESATRSTTKGMTSNQATTFGNGLLTRYGIINTIELVGTTRYPGLAPGTVVSVFLPEIMATWNAQLPIVKLTTTAIMTASGPAYFYTVDATNGANISQWSRVFFT